MVVFTGSEWEVHHIHQDCMNAASLSPLEPICHVPHVSYSDGCSLDIHVNPHMSVSYFHSLMLNYCTEKASNSWVLNQMDIGSQSLPYPINAEYQARNQQVEIL